MGILRDDFVSFDLRFRGCVVLVRLGSLKRFACNVRVLPRRANSLFYRPLSNFLFLIKYDVACSGSLEFIKPMYVRMFACCCVIIYVYGLFVVRHYKENMLFELLMIMKVSLFSHFLSSSSFVFRKNPHTISHFMNYLMAVTCPTFPFTTVNSFSLHTFFPHTVLPHCITLNTLYWSFQNSFALDITNFQRSNSK